jgi:hypothetical protein
MAIALKNFVMPFQVLVGGDFSCNTSGNGSFIVESGTTASVIMPFEFTRSATAGKGGTLNTVLVNYAIGGATNLASITPTLSTITYAPNPTSAAVTVTPTGFTLTAGANYTGTVTIAAPAQDNTATPRRYQLQVNFAAGAADTLITWYGAEINWAGVLV